MWCVHAKSFQSYPTLCNPMDSMNSMQLYESLRSMRFSSKNTGVGCHTLSPENHPNAGVDRHLLSFLHCQVGPLPPVPCGKSKKMGCIYTAEYCSVIKKNETMPFVATWMDLEDIMLSAITKTKKDKHYVLSLVCGI